MTFLHGLAAAVTQEIRRNFNFPLPLNKLKLQTLRILLKRPEWNSQSVFNYV